MYMLLNNVTVGCVSFNYITIQIRGAEFVVPGPPRVHGTYCRIIYNEEYLLITIYLQNLRSFLEIRFFFLIKVSCEIPLAPCGTFSGVCKVKMP